MRVLSDLLQTYGIKMLTATSNTVTAPPSGSTVLLLIHQAPLKQPLARLIQQKDVYIGTAILYCRTKRHKLEIKVL